MSQTMLSNHCLLYYTSINRFIDTDGNVIHNLLPYFKKWQIDEWKNTADYYELVEDNFGTVWELFYLDDEAEEHSLSHRWLWSRHDSDIRQLWDEWYKKNN